MIRIPFEDMCARIQQKAGLSADELKAKIDEKMAKLSGFISKEGAAHILANELGVKLLENSGKIKDIFPGMRNVETVGKVTNVYELREFNRQDGTKGKVASFVIGDDSGSIRVVGWGNHADTVSTLVASNTVKISGAYSREDNRGGKELHLNDSSRLIINPAGVEIGEVKTNSYPKAERKQIKDVTVNDPVVEILGTVVQVFEPRFFEVCPKCSSRLKQFQEKWNCDEHKETLPDYSYVMNIYLDDGSENMRVVLFKNQAEHLLNKTKEEMIETRTAPEKFEAFKTQLLGEQFKIIGKPKHNVFFDKLELVANVVLKANAEEELARLNAVQS